MQHFSIGAQCISALFSPGTDQGGPGTEGAQPVPQPWPSGSPAQPWSPAQLPLAHPFCTRPYKPFRASTADWNPKCLATSLLTNTCRQGKTGCRSPQQPRMGPQNPDFPPVGPYIFSMPQNILEASWNPESVCQLCAEMGNPRWVSSALFGLGLANAKLRRPSFWLGSVLLPLGRLAPFYTLKQSPGARAIAQR